jgi:hypothetical protein
VSCTVSTLSCRCWLSSVDGRKRQSQNCGRACSTVFVPVPHIHTSRRVAKGLRHVRQQLLPAITNPTAPWTDLCDRYENELPAASAATRPALGERKWGRCCNCSCSHQWLGVACPQQWHLGSSPSNMAFRPSQENSPTAARPVETAAPCTAGARRGRCHPVPVASLRRTCTRPL